MKERVIRYDGKEYRRKFPNKLETRVSCQYCDFYKFCYNKMKYTFGSLCFSFLDDDEPIDPRHWWSQTEAE